MESFLGGLLELDHLYELEVPFKEVGSVISAILSFEEICVI